MANNTIQITIIGRVGRDPELRYTQSGLAVCDISVAVTMKWGDKETTRWFKCTAWKGTAENFVAPYVKKGMLVYIFGEDVTSSGYLNNKQEIQANTEITISKIMILNDGGEKPSGNQQSGQKQQQSSTPPPTRNNKSAPPQQNQTSWEEFTGSEEITDESFPPSRGATQF